MTRYEVGCAKCGSPVRFRDAGKACTDAHGEPWIIECDCTGIPTANWNESELPSNWIRGNEVNDMGQKVQQCDD